MTYSCCKKDQTSAYMTRSLRVPRKTNIYVAGYQTSSHNAWVYVYTSNETYVLTSSTLHSNPLCDSLAYMTQEPKRIPYHRLGGR